MTVRVAPVWNAMTANSPDDPPDAVVIADDETGSIRLLHKGGPKDTVGTDSIYEVRRRPGDVESVLERTGGDRLNAMLAVGMSNTMYMTHDPAITDHGTMQEAIDHVYGTIWTESAP